MKSAAARPDTTRTTFTVLVIGILIGSSFLVLYAFLPALVWSVMIVVASWPLLLRVQSWFGGRRSWAVAVMTTAMLLVLVLPLLAVLLALIDNLGAVGDTTQSMIAAGFPSPPSWLDSIPYVGPKLVSLWQQASELGRNEIITRLTPYVGQFLSWLLHQIGSVGLLFVHFLLMTVLAAVLFAKGENASAFIVRFASKLGGEQGEGAIVLAGQAIRAVALGVIVTALIQSVMAGLGFLIAGVPHVLILTAACFFLSIIQVGAGPVLIMVALWLFNTTSPIVASMFLVWAIVVMVADNFIRPFLIKRGADLPLLLIFAGVIGGLIAFGVVGLFVGPVVLALAFTLLNAWVEGEEPAVSS